MSDIVKNLRRGIQIDDIGKDVQSMIIHPKVCDKAADEIERLQKYEKLVQFIANDYYEMSHDKVKWQHNDWYKRCRKLIEEDND